MNYLIKHLAEAGFTIEIIDDEILFHHPALGRAEFPDWSKFALVEIKEYAEQLKAMAIKARNDDQIYENNKEGA